MAPNMAGGNEHQEILARPAGGVFRLRVFQFNNCPDTTAHFERPTGDTLRRTYRFFLVALAVLRRAAFATTVGFDQLAGAAASFVRRTPG